MNPEIGVNSIHTNTFLAHQRHTLSSRVGMQQPMCHVGGKRLAVAHRCSQICICTIISVNKQRLFYPFRLKCQSYQSSCPKIKMMKYSCDFWESPANCEMLFPSRLFSFHPQIEFYSLCEYTSTVDFIHSNSLTHQRLYSYLSWLWGKKRSCFFQEIILCIQGMGEQSHLMKYSH